MNCPHCKKQLNLPTNSVLNMESYGNSILTITECCGKLVTATPIISFSVNEYHGEKTCDDWGREIN
jgi:hypothetical protein